MSEPTDKDLADFLRRIARLDDKLCTIVHLTGAQCQYLRLAAQRLEARSREWKPIHDEDHE